MFFAFTENLPKLAYNILEPQWRYDEMIMISTFYMTNMFSWIFIVLDLWNNSLQVDKSITSLSWFQANQ
jgi:hypothetical protein